MSLTVALFPSHRRRDHEWGANLWSLTTDTSDSKNIEGSGPARTVSLGWWWEPGKSKGLEQVYFFIEWVWRNIPNWEALVPIEIIRQIKLHEAKSISSYQLSKDKWTIIELFLWVSIYARDIVGFIFIMKTYIFGALGDRNVPIFMCSNWDIESVWLRDIQLLPGDAEAWSQVLWKHHPVLHTGRKHWVWSHQGALQWQVKLSSAMLWCGSSNLALNSGSFFPDKVHPPGLFPSQNLHLQSSPRAYWVPTSLLPTQYLFK